MVGVKRSRKAGCLAKAYIHVVYGVRERAPDRQCNKNSVLHGYTCMMLFFSKRGDRGSVGWDHYPVHSSDVWHLSLIFEENPRGGRRVERR